MSAADPPRYVLGSPADATTVLRRLARSGWATREGFGLPEAPWDVSGRQLVLFGRVADQATAGQAVLAAARGAGLVVIADVAADVGRALVEELTRLGALCRDPREEPPGERAGVARLVPEQRALLERLANGETIAAAAAAEFLSLRTANRRIAQARAMLGARTTREAVLAYLRQRPPS